MSASQSPQALFEKAFQDFKNEAGLTPDEEAQFKLTTLEELQKTVQATQLKQESSRRLRYMRRLQIFMDTMDQYGKVIEVFVNAADMVAFIWIAANFSEGFNSLLDAYQEIGESMPQVIQYKDVFHENTNMQKVLAMIYADLLEFHREALSVEATVLGYLARICL
ncbi:hypothetical protein GTA08_BOTSDO11283 [Neofusicoccum parvum]|nr:hypothetical protein GTA08_BOTSDO11283 [Neofusicoccum parvum]